MFYMGWKNPDPLELIFSTQCHKRMHIIRVKKGWKREKTICSDLKANDLRKPVWNTLTVLRNNKSCSSNNFICSLQFTEVKRDQIQFGVGSVTRQFRALFGTRHLTIGHCALLCLSCSSAANDQKVGAVEIDIVTASRRVQVAHLASNKSCRVQFADWFYSAAVRVAAENEETTICLDDRGTINVASCFNWDSKSKTKI